MDFKVIVVFLAMYVSQNWGMPADPIFRVSGRIQSNNPFVKLFSTYPTEKPNSLKDNPNELKKGIDEDKFFKKSKSKPEIDAITPNEDEAPEREGESLLEEQVRLEDSQVTKDDDIHLSDAQKDMNLSLAQEDSETVSSSDPVQTENVEIHEELPELLEPIEDSMASPSQIDEITPIAVEAPVEFILPIVERENVGEFIFDNFGNVEVLDEPSHSFNVEPSSPALIPAEETPKDVEITSPVVEDPLGKKTMVKPVQVDAVEPMKTIAETPEERIEPMASLTEAEKLEPVAEMEPEPEIMETTTSGIDMTESVTEQIIAEESLVHDGTGGLGEIGASMSESEAVSAPIVEAEPMDIFTVGEVEEITPIQEAGAENEKDSLKVTKSESEHLQSDVSEGSEFVMKQDIQTEEPAPMAGFMADASKSTTTETEPQDNDELMVPSTTELTYVLNIEEATTEVPAEQGVDSHENAAESIVNPEPTSDLSFSTTPAAPFFDPIELALQEEEVSGNDPSINETI